MPKWRKTQKQSTNPMYLVDHKLKK
jgi:hypothetical protein